MRSIILADDDDDLRSIYATALRARGHAVHEAADGRAALDLVRSIKADLLLLDIWMPGLNGFEVLDALRHDRAGIRTRVVILTNLTDADARLEAYEAGATEFFVKGEPLESLLSRLGELLQASDLSPE